MDPPDNTAGITLLQLPDDLLARVAHLVGSDAREVCSRLRDAYGPPSCTTLKQASIFFEVEHLTLMQKSGYDTSEKRLRNAGSMHITDLLMFREDTLRDLGQCAARWPGWAANVSRLELLDFDSPGPSNLQQIQQALPALRALKCAFPTKALAADKPAELPQFPGLEQLCLTLGLRQLYRHCGKLQPHAFDLLHIAPALRSLHLDLRFLQAGEQQLSAALQPLRQLTHLELVLSPPSKEWVDDDPHADYLWGALAAVAGRLQSLAFITRPEPLEQLDECMVAPDAGGLPGFADEDDSTVTMQQALAAMMQLTRLCCNIGEQCAIDISALLPLTRLRELHLGHPRVHFVSAGHARSLARQLARLPHAWPALQTLLLPVFVQHVRHTEAGSEGSVECLLRALAKHRPGLRCLRVGHQFAKKARLGTELPEGPHPWLAPLQGMRQLRKLVLLMDLDMVDGLAALSALPLLRELWLRLELAQHVLGAHVHDDRSDESDESYQGYESDESDESAESVVQHVLGAQGQGGQGYESVLEIAALTSLKHLALSVAMGGRPGGALTKYSQYERLHPPVPDSLMCQLLDAATRLPRLQVLDTADLAASSATTTPWLLLAAAPPPQLRELRLCRMPVLPTDHDCPRRQQQVVMHRCVRALLEQQLPSCVRCVVPGGGPSYDEWDNYQWGPVEGAGTSWLLPNMATKWPYVPWLEKWTYE